MDGYELWRLRPLKVEVTYEIFHRARGLYSKFVVEEATEMAVLASCLCTVALGDVGLDERTMGALP